MWCRVQTPSRERVVVSFRARRGKIILADRARVILGAVERVIDRDRRSSAGEKSV